MKALVFQGPQSMAVEERPIPEPQVGEALLRVIATGICGSDLHGYMGKTGRRKPGMVMGHEIAAIVDGVGGTVGSELVGCTVAVNPVVACGECVLCERGRDNLCRSRRLIGVDWDIVGGFSEYMVAPLRNLVPLSSGTTPEQGALVEPFAVGYRAALQAGCREGVATLILGGGTIGIATLAAANRLGAEPVVLSEPQLHRREAARRFGALAVDPRNDDLVEVVRAATDGFGAEAVIDCVGMTQTVKAALASCAPEGTVVLVGMEQPAVELPLYELITQERRLLGHFGYTAAHFREVADWIGSAPKELEGYIEGRVDFDTVVERFHALATGSDASLKVLLTPAAH